MTLRFSSRLAVCLGVCLELLLGASNAHAALAPRRPNIILIVADGLGYGDLGCYGQQIFKTPLINGLAAEGLRVSDGYTGAPGNRSSRYVLLTGHHNGNGRVRDDVAEQGGVGPEKIVPLGADEPTFVKQLKAGGYATGFSGEWLLGAPPQGQTALPGFDEWYGFLTEQEASVEYPPYIWRNGVKTALPDNAGGKKGKSAQQFTTDFALAFVAEHYEKPFFLYVAWRFPTGNGDLPDRDTKFAALPADQRGHVAMIAQLDVDVGRLLLAIKALGISERTLILFTSSRGPANAYPDSLKLTGPFRGAQGSLYDGSIRVPWIVRWPGNIPENTIFSQPCSFADIGPTLIEASGLPSMSDVDGTGLTALWFGMPTTLASRVIYWESHAHGFEQAGRMDNWKAVYRRDSNQFELYDIAHDLGERTNVVAQYPAIERRFRNTFQIEHRPTPYWPDPAPPKK